MKCNSVGLITEHHIAGKEVNTHHLFTPNYVVAHNETTTAYKLMANRSRPINFRFPSSHNVHGVYRTTIISTVNDTAEYIYRGHERHTLLAAM